MSKEFDISIETKIKDLVNQRDLYGDTYLAKAIKNVEIERAKKLIELGADVNISDRCGVRPLNHAVCRNLNLVEKLITEGADVNYYDKNGMTALHDAAETGDLEIVKYLVSHGADVIAKAYDKETPSYFALKNGNLAVYEYLQKIESKKMRFKIIDDIVIKLNTLKTLL